MLEAVVLDFDGVILDSAVIKTVAFAELFKEEDPAHQRLILEHHRAHAGISRYEKFRWAYREALKRPLDAAGERVLGERYNAIVEAKVLAAPFIPGALEFLRSCRLPLFVASGTPEDELRRIVERRGLAPFFRGVFGSPRRKDAILAGIASDLGIPGSSLAMVGDAMTDYEGARSCGAAFIGIVPAGEENSFPAGTTVIPDLRPLAGVLGLAG